MIGKRVSLVLVLALLAGVLTATACEESDDEGSSTVQSPEYSEQESAGFSQSGSTDGQIAIMDSGIDGSTPAGAIGVTGGGNGTEPSRDASTGIPDSGPAIMDAQVTKNDGGGIGGMGGTSGTGGADTGGAGIGESGTGGGTGGTGETGVTPSGCTEPEKEVCNNGTGSHCGYNYEYWKDRGTGCLTNTSDGFSVEWSNINNLLGRKGLRPGSKNQIVTYDANYQPNGNSYLCVYGWTKNPLIEYYIVDSWGSWRPPGGQGHIGTVDSDGGTYDIYRTQRVNQPSIQGTATFYQYWSVRTAKRSNGTITVANHFDAWQSHGMNMGSLYEVSMCVEGYQSSGSADVTVSMK